MEHAATDTPLHAAVKRRDVAAVQLALEGGADVNQRNGYGRTPLHDACSTYHDADVAALLVRWGADVAALNKLQQTPLSGACCHGHYVTAMLLLASCETDTLWLATDAGWTPLAFCMIWPAMGGAGKTAIAKALLATPGFLAPLPRVIAAVQKCEVLANTHGAIRTPAHPLVFNAIAQQKNWLRRRTLLLLRMLANKGRATWRCRCTDCLRRRKRQGAGVRGTVSVWRQHVPTRTGSKAGYVCAGLVAAVRVRHSCLSARPGTYPPLCLCPPTCV